MQKNKIALIFAIILCSVMATSILPLPSANAQSSNEVASYPYLFIGPDPVGLGQTTYISMLVDVPLPSSSEANDIRRHGYKLTITAPDGTTKTESWDIIWDTTGVQFTTFTPNQVGTYEILFEYAGQEYTWSGSANGRVYLPASVTSTLTVQEDPIPEYPQTPLPTEYWTRPIHGQNSNWYTLASHWLGGNHFGLFQQSGYNLWQQSGTGPGSSHIMWTNPIEAGGVVGGINTGIDGATYYSGGSYEGRFQRAIILDGRLYYDAPLSDDPDNGAYTCVDLKTGEVLWTNPDINPSFGELYCYESPNQHGVIPNGYLWQTSGSGTQTWYAYDPLTGNNVFNLTGVPSGTDVYTQNGEIVRYILNYNRNTQEGWLALWNWTAAPSVAAGSSGSNAIQYRPVGKTIDTSTAYSWNITISYDITGKQNQNPSIVYVVPGDVILGRSSSITAGVGASRSTPDPYTVWAISLQEGQEGRLLWKKDFAAPSGNLSRTLGPLDPVNRVWTMTDAETMQWLGYSLDTGNLIWGPTTTEVRGMQFFSSGSGAGQRAVTAYGNFYVQGFGGELFCYDASNGNLLWKYNNTNSGIETPWGLMPIFVAAIADGKVYAFNNEHSPNSPLYNGYSIYCINATTGDEIYKMLSWSGQTGGTGTSTAVLADGYLTYYNYYDNSIYCVGKGPSQTTVSASPKVTTYGSSVIVEGTVIDIAAGTKQAEEAARFPNGVPAVSDESMSDWMEYVYMQQAKPLDVKGVTVELYVLDANNNYRSIGTTTTDSSGFYSYQWTPDIEGKYTVYAVFAGSESYYPSQATTAFGVDAVEATPEPTETPPSVADQYFIPAIVGLFILGIITLVLIVLVMLKKKE